MRSFFDFGAARGFAPNFGFLEMPIFNVEIDDGFGWIDGR